MILLLKAIKRKVEALCLKWKNRIEARRAFKYDMAQFIAHAGVLHLDRKPAACAEIVMGYHVLEKGLTMPNRRLGFGKGAVVHLINLIDSFEERFGNDSQVTHAIAVLRAYRELHKDWHEPMPRLDAFLAAHPDVPAAIQPHVTRDEFYAAQNAPFPTFAASRHVVRHFASSVPQGLLKEAIELALTAPSACNRQHVRIHIIDNPQMRDSLLALQGGTRGFGGDADKVVVVTSDLSSVRWAWERHDCYINGGIFVMNLSYALHYKGVAHCILHWSVSPDADRQAHGIIGVPENEAIVQLFVCGMPPEEFDVAASPRRPLDDIVTWHGGCGDDSSRRDTVGM
ncbi:MAG: nitroreductase family protein [Victivallales bacterium]|nr:nitroreductase family protein [Victivallales bacterium]